MFVIAVIYFAPTLMALTFRVRGLGWVLATNLPFSWTGYQAEATRGRLLLDGATTIKMLGRYVTVRAEVVDIPAFSVHSDQEETLQWLASAPSRPEIVYVVHGDPPAARALTNAILKRLGWNAVAPRYLEQVRID